MLVDGASTTSCGSLFHSLTIRKLKKFCLTVVRHLGLNNFNECPLSPLVTSPVQRTCCSWHVLFQSVSWTFLSNLNGRPNPNPAHEGPKCTLKSIWYRIVSYRIVGLMTTGNESVPILLAQCRFPWLAVSNAKIVILFSNKIYGRNFFRQHWETVRPPTVWNYQNADCSLRKKLLCHLFSAHFRSLFIR